MSTPATSLAADWGSWLDLILKLTLAALAGGAIGWNRQARGKAAGLRTHMLVSLGAALFVLIPLETGATPSADAVSRTIQGVATGIGFLGAGEIVHHTRSSGHKSMVKGLTSAASIWVTAALGMVIASGLWRISLIGTVLTLLILGGAKRIEQLIPVVHDEE